MDKKKYATPILIDLEKLVAGDELVDCITGRGTEPGTR